MLELDSGMPDRPQPRGMTVDDVIEKLQQLDGGQHLELHVIDDESGQVWTGIEIRQGWLATSMREPGKVVLYIAVNSWD